MIVSIIEANGQLGVDLVKTFREDGVNVIEFTHNDIEIENYTSVENALLILIVILLLIHCNT